MPQARLMALRSLPEHGRDALPLMIRADSDYLKDPTIVPTCKTDEIISCECRQESLMQAAVRREWFAYLYRHAASLGCSTSGPQGTGRLDNLPIRRKVRNAYQ